MGQDINDLDAVTLMNCLCSGLAIPGAANDHRCGLKIAVDKPPTDNPRYRVWSSDSWVAQVCFSNVPDAPPDSASDYCAVMNCSAAVNAFPVALGCDLRIPIRHEVPLLADDPAFDGARDSAP